MIELYDRIDADTMALAPDLVRSRKSRFPRFDIVKIDAHTQQHLRTR